MVNLQGDLLLTASASRKRLIFVLTRAFTVLNDTTGAASVTSATTGMTAGLTETALAIQGVSTRGNAGFSHRRTEPSRINELKAIGSTAGQSASTEATSSRTSGVGAIGGSIEGNANGTAAGASAGNSGKGSWCWAKVCSVIAFIVHYPINSPTST
ncbi:MAG: hypothetical protein WCD18_11065 [Thermosynechococcaceae cyanobacterium]